MSLGLGLNITNRHGGDGLGPEIAPAITDGTWALTLSGGAVGTVTDDGTGAHFAAANNISSVSHTITAGLLEDNATYRVTYTVANYVGGGSRVLVGGTTANHGHTGATHNGAGTFTEDFPLNTTFGSTNLIRIQATGANGANTFDVTSISVRKVL